MKDKIRIKATGEITYCNTVRIQDGIKIIGNKEFPNFVPHFYKTDNIEDGEWQRDEFEFIPQWPYELFGIECGQGWYELLKPIFVYIEEYNKNTKEEEQIQIHQIKEKWGELCVYTNFYTDELHKLIEKAEAEASVTCELCGSKENVGMAYEGWLTTECHKCMKEWCIKNEKPHRWKRYSDNKIYWVLPDKDDELFEGKEL